MGRSSNSSDYQLSANRLISRVHVKATYHGPSEERSDGEVVIECVGWNGCKVHYLGQVADLAKGQSFVTDGRAASIMVDVQDTRVLLLWPKKEATDVTRSPSLEASPIKRNPAADMFASSPPSLFSRLDSPVSPTPAALPANSTFAETFIADESFSLDDHLPVKVYEDHESPDDLPREATPPPAASSSPVVTPLSSPVKVSLEPAPESNGQSEPGELSEHDEENDPIVISFGPFGDNLLAKFEGLDSTSPDRRRKTPTVSPLSAKSSPRRVEVSVARAIRESPIKNHVINQLAFSRVHSIPISQIYSNLPSEMKTVVDDKGKLTSKELKTVLDKITCVGEISRNGKDAAGKPLENEFYYIPDFDEDEPRRTAVSVGKPPLRNVRKQHKVNLPPIKVCSSHRTNRFCLAILLETTSSLILWSLSSELFVTACLRTCIEPLNEWRSLFSIDGCLLVVCTSAPKFLRLEEFDRDMSDIAQAMIALCMVSATPDQIVGYSRIFDEKRMQKMKDMMIPKV